MLLESERSKGPRCPHPPPDTTLSGSSAPVCPDPDPSETSSDDKGGVHNESENKRGASGSSSGEDISDFNSKKLKVSLVTGSLVFLCKVARCYVLLMLMETLQKRTNIKSTAAALEAAWITEFNEKKRLFMVTEKSSLRIIALSEMNREESISNFASSTRKLYGLQAAMWNRDKVVRKGAPNLVAREFACGGKTSFCHRVIFRQISHTPSLSGLPLNGFINWAFVPPATRRELTSWP